MKPRRSCEGSSEPRGHVERIGEERALTGQRLVDQLWERHQAVAPYPRGVIGIPKPIDGLAFFPGGCGLYVEPGLTTGNRDLPVGGIMVLGHDFHSEAGYRASIARGGEARTQPTWRNLIALLAEAGVDLGRCFFTNAYMGLRRGEATTGVFPGASDAAFVKRCLEFLDVQLATLRPRVILTLGRYVPPLLATRSPDLREWVGARSFKDIDATSAVKRNVSFAGVHGELRSNVVALTHPSLRHASIRHRRFAREGKSTAIHTGTDGSDTVADVVTGHAAEIAMLRAVVDDTLRIITARVSPTA